MINKLLAVLSLAVLFVCATPSKADVQGIDFTSPNPADTFNNRDGYSLGYEFTATSAGTVDALGYFDNGSKSTLGESHLVGLYNSSGVLLGSAVVSSSTGTQAGFFDYVSISGISLVAGHSYEVMGSSGVSDPYTFDVNGLTTASNIAFDQNEYTAGNALAFGQNSQSGASSGFYGANFEETVGAAAAPEPSSLILLGTGLVSVVGVARRRMKV